MNDTHPPGDHAINPSVRYERADANFRGIVTFGVGLVFICVACAALLWGLFVYAIYHEDEVKKSELPFKRGERAGETQQPRQQPTPFEPGTEQSGLDPRPRLEGVDPYETGRIPTSNARLQTKGEEQWLGEAAWQDRAQGVVRIPIEQAMKQVAGDLKFREGGAKEAEIKPPSRSSSGRQPREEKE